ncbi:MAG: NAD(P)/FAD-dependent oxidoreductase [Chloroflexi bacterium]|nr:NAD(P)/FAD-dependent oxidoreductase [Chloroflexota bacterium]
MAVAHSIARDDRAVFVLEKNAGLGQETSSRHSGVIHSGIYYPPGSLKASLCLEGNRMLYALCEKHGIGHRRLGKIIAAAHPAELGELDRLQERGGRNGVAGLRRLSRAELKKLEPEVAGLEALLLPSTGIVDAPALMRFFAASARGRGTQILCRSEVTAITKQAAGYRVAVRTPTEQYYVNARTVVNCAGLHSAAVAGLAGMDVAAAGYEMAYFKGEYFSIARERSKLVRRLVYPVPPSSLEGVGIHITLDLEGRMRLGPNAFPVQSLDYSVDVGHKRQFYESARKLLPALEIDDLEPDTAGIRPRLKGSESRIMDFVIREESGRGLPGFINLVGIESPGLTSSPAIGEYVAGLLRETER